MRLRAVYTKTASHTVASPRPPSTSLDHDSMSQRVRSTTEKAPTTEETRRQVHAHAHTCERTFYP